MLGGSPGSRGDEVFTPARSPAVTNAHLFQLVLHTLVSPPGPLWFIVCSVQVTRISDCKTKLFTN